MKEKIINKMKKIFKNIAYCIILIIVAPAAVIHTTYRLWYFKNFVLKSGADNAIKKRNKLQ